MESRSSTIYLPCSYVRYIALAVAVCTLDRVALLRRHFDVCLVISAGRFTETEVALLNELRHYSVPHFAVRSKVDTDIDNNEADNGTTPEETKRSIADDLRRRGVSDPYLINGRRRDEHDFPKLLRDVHAAVIASRRYAA